MNIPRKHLPSGRTELGGQSSAEADHTLLADRQHSSERDALSVVEAATRAGVSRTFLYERISSGELPTIKAGKRRLVRVEALRRWLVSLETRAA